MDARVRLGACEWCGKDAYTTIVLRPSAKTAHGLRATKKAMVCPGHAARFQFADEVGVTTTNREQW